MEPISSAFSIMAALPQCIQSAKQLYDLRERYKDASILITAIYSESMVIAASLSQVQNLLQHDAIARRPDLIETFDRALTGCRIVYGCLDEEVRDLADKSARDDLRFKDRARFLWKEDTFKELLTQIRGQQSALTLLIQGLQMESMADIRRLVQDNSSKLDQVMKRSRTLRQAHPRIQVPESIFSYESGVKGAEDAESIVKSTQFDFDDQVINSKAYRRAMARYTMNTTDMTHLDLKQPEPVETEVFDEDSTMMGTVQGIEPQRDTNVAGRTQRLVAQITSGSEDDMPMTLPKIAPADYSTEAKQTDRIDPLAQDMSPSVPQTESTIPYFSPIRADTLDTTKTEVEDTPMRLPVRSFSEGSTLISMASPPLPPRRTSGPQLRSQDSNATLKEARSHSIDESPDASDGGSVTSGVSEGSSYTTYESTRQDQTISSKPTRKPLPLAHKASYAVIGSLNKERAIHGVPPTLESEEMHAIWLQLVEAERSYVDRIHRLRKMFYDNIVKQWPALEPHLGIVLMCEQLAALNKKLLWLPMEQHLVDSDMATCDPAIFNTWTTNVQRLFREYSQALPHAVGAVRATQVNDPKFSPFVNTLGLSIAYFGKGWEDYLKLPLTQLDFCIESVRNMIGIATELQVPGVETEIPRLTHALDALSWLRTAATAMLKDSQSREDTQNLERRIHTLDANILSQLELLEPSRRVVYQGGMTMKLKSKGPWHPVHVVLLDNYLFWGKVKAQKKGSLDRILVFEAPIPVKQLIASLPTDQHQYQKATMFDEVPRNSIQHATAAKKLGCEPTPIENWPDPFALSNLFKTMWALSHNHILDYMRGTFDDTSANRTVSTYETKILGDKVIFTCDPKNVQAILATQFNDFELGQVRRGSFAPLLGHGIFSADGKQWERARAILRPQFSRNQISDLDLEERHVQNLLRALPLQNGVQSDVIDLQPLFYRLSMDSASEFLFGQSTNTQLSVLSEGDSHKNVEDTEFVETFEACQRRIMMAMLLNEFYALLQTKSFRDKCKLCHRYIDKFVRKALRRTEEGIQVNTNRNEKYIFAESLAKETSDPAEIRDQLLSILVAGRDTTASFMSFLFLMLAQHPDVFKKLRGVIVENFGTFENPKNLSFESLKSCSYLQWCLNETLRLHPPLPWNSRRSTRDTSLPRGGGKDGNAPIFVPKGTETVYIVWLMQRKPEIWGEDAETFEPERWSSHKYGGFEYLPFNGGPRICLDSRTH
ncbi:hypothetical protein E8E13_003372 [Curvularia kusanoi]|uniref:Uncharacterized protein n=1 Tax=Curvularia kusanoi TaxID=90978 RepID=A0A9P4T4Z0_CURKU|nr:hypothetical protein E8E13_003372 [Curvularia kusanoi]